MDGFGDESLRRFFGICEKTIPARDKRSSICRNSMRCIRERYHMEWIQYRKEENDKAIEDKILALEETAWPRNTDEIFPSAPDTYVTSFVLLDADMAVCHVGIRKKVLIHREVEYMAYGLSEVVTHPDYRCRGLGTQMLRRAADFILSEKPDISIFTCAPKHTAFYANAGWQTARNASLVGGTKEAPFRSDSLRLVTMIRWISDKGIAHRKDFENTDIVLELGEKQLW